MKNLLKPVVQWLLKILSRAVVRKYKPRVVAITGSVGKTTTKDFIVAMLAERFRVRGAAGNYNNELGVPLTVLGKSSGTTVRHWWGVYRHGLALLLRRHDYPEVLVLEMGADRPGDIQYLTSIAPPDISVVTNVGSAHLERYGSLEDIAGEKSYLVGRMKPDGVAVLNFDDVRVRMMQTLAPGRVIYYGFEDEANLWVSDVKQTESGLNATLHLSKQDGIKPVSWPLQTSLTGRHQLYAVLAAFAVAYAAGVVPEHALAVATTFHSPPGRLRLLPGQEKLTIIDDSYNASPEAVLAALEVLQERPGPHRAILGDMLELGKASEEAHRRVGQIAGPMLDELVVVGDRGALIAEGAKEAGMEPSQIWFAAEAGQAAGLLKGRTGTVLVKGSRAVHLERATKDLLRDPRDANRLVDR